jgi:GTPase SAR1 family protein
MAVAKAEIVFKILLIGDSGVGKPSCCKLNSGKSSFLVRYVDDEFEDGRSCTIGLLYTCGAN